MTNIITHIIFACGIYFFTVSYVSYYLELQAKDYSNCVQKFSNYGKIRRKMSHRTQEG